MSSFQSLCALQILMQPSQYEKVIQSYKTGIYIPSGNSSAKTCNTWVKQYNVNFNKMSDKCWEEILKYYDTAPYSDFGGGVEQSILDEGWAALPMSSSP